MMIVTQFTKDCLASRRQAKKLKALGYRRHETDWEIHRGGLHDHIILDAVISTDGMYVYTKIGKKPQDFDESRIDVIGQNGNLGTHYDGGDCV